MENNKKVLTFEEIKKDLHPSNANVLGIIFIIMLICNISFIPFLLIHYILKINGLIIMLMLFLIVTLLTIGFGYLASLMKKQSKEDFQKIINGKFKIVEDKIYDKYDYSKRDSDGRISNYYFIFLKIYGKISVDYNIYKNIVKEESIYLIFLDNKEKINNYDYQSDKVYQSKGIQKKYLVSDYELAEELKKYLIPYDETLGEKNFNNRINDMINEMKEKNNKVICKSCGKEYKTNNQNVCPSCYSIYKYGIKDVVYQKEWY